MNKVVLLHGLLMNQWIMHHLGARLTQSGFVVDYFDYATRAQSARQNAQDLCNFLHQRHLLPCHFVAHSLGGLVLRHLAAIAPDCVQGRVVTLGSPHQGSQVAQKVHDIAPFVLGKSWQQGLDGDLPEWTLNTEIGNIIGVSGMGLGRWLGHLPLPHDGTVAQCETVLSGSVVLTVSCGHTGLLFDKCVAQQTAHFLQNGCFQTLQH